MVVSKENKKIVVVVQNKYGEKYSESSFFDKIKNTIKSAGLKLIYEALQL